MVAAILAAVIAAAIRRGNNIVFRLHSDPATRYVKLSVGLPGDRIQMKEAFLSPTISRSSAERGND